MKKLLFLVAAKGRKKRILVDYLSQTLAGSVQVSLGKFSDLIFELDANRLKVRLGEDEITKFDLIYFRHIGTDFLSLAGTLAICLDFLKVEYFDTTFGQIGPAGNKLTSLIKLWLAGLPVMPSFFCWRDKLEGQLDYIAAQFGFPLVAKEISRHQGKGTFLIKNKHDFDFLKKVDPSDQFLFQKFYPNEEEYRLVVLGRKIGVYYRKVRTNPEEFRANTARGAQEKYLSISQAPEEMKQAALSAAKILGLQITGVDFLIDSQTQKMWILEANRGPGFTYDSEISPELPALADFFAKKLSAEKNEV